MAFDPAVADQLTAQLLTNANRSSHRVDAIAESNLQGLNVIQATTIQAQASVSDDPGLIAALQTASRAPQQGQSPAAS